MATAEEGRATAATTNSFYSGGAGGKFRKKPFRHQTTPYDRPPTVLLANSNESNASWLTKLVVDPASKLISYGAHRFFGSILQRRLPPPSPSPTQAPEVNHDLSGVFQGAAELGIHESSKQELKVSEPSQQEHSQLINNSNSNGISELEQFLKQNTFTRSEIDHLTELLHSRALEERQKKEAASVFGRHEIFSGGLSNENRNEGIRFHGAMSTPIFKSKVLEDDIDSPAELAKSYMGSRPTKVSPSMLGMNSHREDIGLLNNIPFTSKSPIMPFTKSSVGLGAAENSFISPRSRGRSAIYNMARTPNSRVPPTSIVKGGGIHNNNFGQSTPLSSLSLLERREIIESKSTTLKRSCSFLDDEISSVGPMRRIRQKHNLLAPRDSHSAHGVEIGSVKPKLPLFGQGNHELSKAAVENKDGSMPSTSYASVPSKSSEVASRILQHLGKLSPKEKSSTSKSVAVRDKSPFKLTPDMLHGQALRSMEDVGTSMFMLDVQDDSKIEDRSKDNLPDALDFTSGNHGKVKESWGKEFVAPIISGSPAKNNDFKVPLQISGPSTGKADSLVRNGAYPPKKRAFRMSVQEDSFEQEDDIHNNGVMLRSLSESKGPTGVPPMESTHSTSEDPKMVKNTIQPEVKSTSAFEFSKTSEFGGSGSGKFGETSGEIAISASEEVNKASQSTILPPPATARDKTKDNSPPLFSFSSKISDKFPPLPAESSRKTSGPKLDSTSSFINTTAPNGSQLKTPESQNGGLDPLEVAADQFGKSDNVPPATNGPTFGSEPPAFSFNAASNNTNQVSPGVGVVSTSSTSIASFASTATATTTSGSPASTGCIFGSTVAPATSAEPVLKFGSSTSVSALSAANNRSELADAIRQSFDSSSSAVPSFSSASSGSSMFGLTPSTTNSLPFNPQSSMFNSASKSTASGNGTAPQGSSAQAASSISLPPFTTNTSPPFGLSFSNSQPFNSKPTSQFGLSFSSDANSIAPVSEPTPSVAKFGASSTSASDNTAVTSNSNSSPGIFTFGLTSSSTSANTIGSTTAATSAPFIFSGSSVVNTSSSYGGGTSGVFNFGGSSSSSASSSTTTSSITSSSAPNIFSSSFQSSPISGSTFASSSPSTGFAFGGLSTPSAPTNTAPSIFSTPLGSASTPIFSFTASSVPAIPTQSRPAGGSPSPMFKFADAPAPALSTPLSQTVFGAPAPGFGAFPGNNNQMSAEDSMAEDPVQSTTPVFGQPAVSPSPPPGAFMFGQAAPPPVQQANLFQFGGIGSVNPNPFQASSSLEFNTGGSFSLGSGGGDKSGRRTVRVSRNRNRKK